MSLSSDFDALLRLVLLFEVFTFAYCLVGTVISASLPGVTTGYFGRYRIAWPIVLVPTIIIGVVQIIAFGFTLNLYCYHRWLRKNGITTLEHIFKYNSSKTLNKVGPAGNSKGTTQKDTERGQLKSGSRPHSSSRNSSSKKDGQSVPLESGPISRNSLNSESRLNQAGMSPLSSRHQKPLQVLISEKSTTSKKDVASRTKFLRREPKLEEPTTGVEPKSPVRDGGGETPRVSLSKPLAKQHPSPMEVEVKGAAKVPKRNLTPVIMPK